MNRNINILLALLAIDALLDAIFLESLFGSAPTDEDEDEPSLRGKFYTPDDNSWAKDLEAGCDTGGLVGKRMVIVSDPYEASIKEPWMDEPITNVFIDVFSIESGRKYRVLFHENCVED